MRGGLKMYRGSAAAARSYVEADRGRVDDYYLAEGTGLAERFVASPVEGVRRVGTLAGDAYEAWVAGLDPETRVPRGRLRGDGQAVRFVEVVVNGPKSWSLAAELHPDVGAAYASAQDRAATEILAWLAEHARTRVGPRGAQVQVPVQQLGYAATIHAVQGDIATTDHLVLGEHTGAASAYVGMTRGRAGNTAHLVADSLDQAREQWITTFTHDRADLGPAHAANLAEIEAQRYARHRPLQTGRLGRHRRAVRQARDHLQQWADTWRPILPELPADLRHTAASLAVSAGANVKAVQRMLGHASAAMTLDVYSSLFDDDVDGVAARLDEQMRRVESDLESARCVPVVYPTIKNLAPRAT